jgi:hypothetical protein
MIRTVNVDFIRPFASLGPNSIKSIDIIGYCFGQFFQVKNGEALSLAAALRPDSFMGMIRYVIFFFLMAWTTQGLKADEVDRSFAEWKDTLEVSAQKLGETLVLTLDRKRGLLIVSKEFRLNEMRKNTLVQSVPVAGLVPEIEFEGVSRLPEPWIKIRCQNNQKRVSSQKRVLIEGAEVEEVSKDENKTFLVISCHRSDLIKAKEQGETFLRLTRGPIGIR